MPATVPYTVKIEVWKMKKVLRNTVQLKRQKFINKIIKSGIYKKNHYHLYELTLSDLEKEYKSIEKIIWGQE